MQPIKTKPLLRLDHVGYAVADIRKYVSEFVEPLIDSASVSPIVEDPIQRVRISFVTLSNGSRIELIEPTHPDSPVSKVLAMKRGGLCHLCYETADLTAAVDELRNRGFMAFSGPHPAVAFGGRRIVFLQTPQRDVIELVETGGNPQ